MRRARYREGDGVLIITEDRLLFLPSSDHASAPNIERSAFGNDPLRSLALDIAELESPPPLAFAWIRDDLYVVACGDIALDLDDDGIASTVDGASDDFWGYAACSVNTSVSYGDDSGSFWVSQGAVRASSFCWLLPDDLSHPLVLTSESSLEDEGMLGYIQALVCFDCGAPSPPMTARCRSCMAFLTEDNSNIQAVKQPNLGVIRLSDGRSEPLDHDLAIGRNPDPLGADTRHRVIVHGTGDPSISRRHLELHRQGWQVTVTSLNRHIGATVEGHLGRRAQLEFGVAHRLSDGDIVRYGREWLQYHA